MRLFNRKSKEELRFENYVKTVLDAVALEFEWSDITKDLAWKHMEHPTDHFEFICDNPGVANYKLKFYRGKFHLAYYGLEQLEHQHKYLETLLETIAP